MFYYYGRKKQMAKHYPSPNYDTIIEPFAGSAAYSLFGDNWQKNVILIEKDKQVNSNNTFFLFYWHLDLQIKAVIFPVIVPISLMSLNNKVLSI